MKNLIFIIIATLGSLALFSSCDESVLNMQPLNEMSEEDVWNDPGLVRLYLNDIYQGMGHGYIALALASGVDETKHTHGWDDGPVRQSILTPDNLGFFQSWANWFPHFKWEDLYSKIRDTNILLENIGDVEMGQEDKNIMTGEAFFLRAYFYHNLVRLWGGVPVLTKAHTMDDDFFVSRNSFEETINQIVEDLNEAAQLLPEVANQDGRATRGAALTLKSRILLYAASDLYHENPGGIPETGYSGGDQQARWRAAKDAAQDVIDMNVYSLYEANPAPGDSTAENYANIWLVDGHSETILQRHFTSSHSYEWFQADIGLFNGPNGWHNWGGDTPLQQHVDAYEMADGTSFNWDNPDHANDPYMNRDPRFYGSIFYNGSQWRQRPDNMLALDPDGIVQTADYEVEGQSELRAGLDTRSGPIEDWNGTHTGYYMRKFADPTVNHQFEMQERPWIYMRYAEVLLNYAEASVELGEDADARNALNQIRRRAGMPDVPAAESGDELLERVRNERRVELAFEEHRFFDVRRWMIAPDVYEDGRRIRIIGRLNGDGSYTYEYSVETADNRGWNERAYFLPILRDEINSNSNLVQNPGYN
ncbi:MAG: RagB/SusD family nutrient uptake outer membrane protein [Balneolaceae bacterium]